MTSSEIPRVLVGGFHTVAVTRLQLAETMTAHCLEARKHRTSWKPKLVFSSNGQGIALAGQSKDFANAMGEATIIHADGMPVVFASRLTSTRLPERIATTDFFHDAAQAAVANGLSFYMLGASEAQNSAAAAAIKKLYPGLKIVGRHHGYFDASEDERICQDIRQSGADVLWVALGKPRQEYWCVKNRNNLHGVGWLKTCGGLYAFLTGEAPRAPMWMQNLGLEWLFRAFSEPTRLGWRYLMTNPYSTYRLLRYTRD